MRRTGLAVICFALTACVLGGGAAIASAEEGEVPEATPGVTPGVVAVPAVGCVANAICVYTSANYENPYAAFECTNLSGAWTLGGNRHSATNRCGNKTDWLRENGTVIACMNPGGDRPNPGAFNEIFIAKEFGSFC